LNVAGKFKGLLDKVKKPDTKSKAGNSAEAVVIDAVKTPETTEATGTTDKSAKITDKFRGLLGKAKKPSANLFLCFTKQFFKCAGHFKI
jgi:hypothetical protein